ncbi:UNVERIFIED_CONTAM: hypothetical protein PYX00_002245 [Menopon gallinae]|uniref:Uncharacterized protein n=1 Tax=Menopon gallinae TaxID=328185 RepID=A0AAW2II73_9NEOP
MQMCRLCPAIRTAHPEAVSRHFPEMIATVILSVILFAASARAGEASPVDIQQDIQNAQARIQILKQDSETNVRNLENTLKRNQDDFKQALDQYAAQAMRTVGLATEKIDLLERKYIGEAIDKNKNINAFRCIVKAKGDTDKDVGAALTARRECSKASYTKNNEEMNSLLGEVSAIQWATAGLYDQLYNSVRDCRDKECISKIVHKAEDRYSSMDKVLQRYRDRSGDVRTQFNQGQVDCLKILQNKCDNSVKNCESKMKSC